LIRVVNDIKIARDNDYAAHINDIQDVDNYLKGEPPCPVFKGRVSVLYQDGVGTRGFDESWKLCPFYGYKIENYIRTHVDYSKMKIDLLELTPYLKNLPKKNGIETIADIIKNGINGLKRI